MTIVSHWDTCWKDSSEHWECAVLRVERLEKRLVTEGELAVDTFIVQNANKFTWLTLDDIERRRASIMTTKQLVWLCILYEWWCPDCRGAGAVEEKAYPPGQAVTTCSRCHGTGRIPLLEGVREPCGGVDSYGCDGDNCTACHGLDWIPTEDAWRWLWIAESKDVLAWSVSRTAEIFKYEFYHALELALRPLAINAAEAQEWVRENIV